MSGTAEAFSRGKIDGMAMKSGWILTDGEKLFCEHMLRSSRHRQDWREIRVATRQMRGSLLGSAVASRSPSGHPAYPRLERETLPACHQERN